MNESTPRVMIVQLDSGTPPGLYAEELPQARIIRFDEGELLPPLTEISQLIVLGGHTHAYDDALAPVAQLLTAALAAEIPVLGICLGAQLLAVATGGAVEIAAPSGPEQGIIDVRLRPDAAADPVLAPVVERLGRTIRAVSMHSDAITDLPPKATWLASSAQYPFQAFRIGSGLGVQFHPEADATTYAQWQARETGADPATSREEWQADAQALTGLATCLVGALVPA